MLTKRDFSQLSEEIIHHILSFCAARESVRSSVLCRAWYDAYSTRPVLIFDPDQFDEELNSIDDFRRFLGNTLQSYEDRSIGVEELRFNGFEPKGYHYKYGVIDEWIRKSIGCSVKKLHLTAICPFSLGRVSPTADFPQTIYHAESLEELDLTGSYIWRQPSRGDLAVVARNLKKLSVCMYDVGLLERLLPSCPKIEDLKIIEEFSEIKLSCLLNLRCLKKFEYSYGSILEDVEPPYSFQSLTDLRLRCVRVRGEFFQNFGSKFPRLLYSKFEFCTFLSRREENEDSPIPIPIPIPMDQSLRCLEISNAGVAKMMDLLHLPSLLHYCDYTLYDDRPWMDLDLRGRPHGVASSNEVISSKLTARFCELSSLSSSVLLRLRGLLEKLAFSRISLEIRLLWPISVLYGGVDAAPPPLPPPLKIHELGLIVEYTRRPTLLAPDLGNFMRICRPDTITLQCWVSNDIRSRK